LGCGLHAIQDFYAHNVKLGNHYIFLRTSKKYLEDGHWGNLRNHVGEKPKKMEKDELHKNAADNGNAAFVNSKWVWKPSGNQRIANARSESIAYLKTFLNSIGG
jgi:hypothetical protein